MFPKIILAFFSFLYGFSVLATTAELEWQHYTSYPSIKEQFSDYAFFKMDHKLDFKKDSFYFDSQIYFKYSLDRSKFSYFDLSELYVSYDYELEIPIYSVHSIEINLGRKIKRWSLGDSYWGFNLWNPINRWNPLHPLESGLIGSFFTFKASQWESNFFIGAVHVPGQGVDTVKENGRIYSRSRWFSMLPSQVHSLNIDIYYSQINPFIFDVLFQQSFLFSFKTWSKTSEAFYWIKWAFADKPANHLFFVLNQNNRLQVEKAKGGEVFVNQKITVLPVRQRVLSAEWGLDYKDVEMTFSLENTNMKEPSIPPEYLKFVAERDNFTYFSSWLKYNYLDNSFFRLSYIQSWFKNVGFSRREPSLVIIGRILEGVGVDWQAQFFTNTNQPLFLNLKYQYSFLDQGAWLSAKARYYMTPQIYTEITMDILGAVEFKDGEGKNNSFLNAFKHNDYFTWGLAYDF